MVSFTEVGAFKGVQGGPDVINNPTSLQFGPDGRLYVAEQNGSINAFTIVFDNGNFIATAHELLKLPDGEEVVKSIQNHNDDGSLSTVSNRQVTGIVVTGTAAAPVLYVSSSDPRIAKNQDSGLDTNSGVITRVSWTGSTWEAVDIIRGLPRSEENHSVNGMVLSADGTKLYVAVGGNTNNGAPSQFFAYTGEYTLSGTVLEVDLLDINSRAILTDPAGGQGGQPRQYVYDLPTLDDPTVANNGVREDSQGLDVSGPWGGNDGFNQVILPADAPLRIYADGFRNHYDLVLTESQQLYTVDNGSNGNLGGDPVVVNGEVTNQPKNGGSGDPEPLFLIEEGEYYGHPAPVRANQDLAWTVYNDDGNPEPTLAPSEVSDLSALVPDSVNIPDGFVIAPSQFTADSDRLQQSGVRIERDSNQSNALVNIGSSSNGLMEYTGDAFGGALKGDLLVAQFNGNIGRLDLNAAGTAATYATVDGLSGLSTPLDVAMGPNGTVWAVEIGGDFIKAFAPDDGSNVGIDDLDADKDGILNVDDPFIQDATNGGSVIVFPNVPLLWDFDANQDDNLPGPDGYGGGLTGVMINGVTDYEAFFQSPSNVAGQNIKLDNVKFITAAGGGTTVVESVSNGDAFLASNDGEFLFHTGVTIAPTVKTFNVKWSVFNPAGTPAPLVGPYQQIGGYIGTGDQSNYLKIVAIEGVAGEIEILLEDNDTVQSATYLQADEVFSNVPDNGKIYFDIEIDVAAQTATPTVTYDTTAGLKTVSGNPVSLSNTAVWEAIAGKGTVQGQQSGLAVGLYTSNTGQSAENTFQAVFDDIEITATGNSTTTVLYRVNAGGPEVAALDGGPAWSADTAANNSAYLALAGSNKTATFNVQPGSTVGAAVPAVIYQSERWDAPGGSPMAWAFYTPEPGIYEVRLYVGNGFEGTSVIGERVFDVAIEGTVFNNTNDIDLVSQFGHLQGGVITNLVSVTDGTLNVEFLHGVENPLINGIEILQVGEEEASAPPQVSIISGNQTVGENEGQVQISLTTDATVPSDETVTVTFEIVPGTATPGEDYAYTSLTASFDDQTGIYRDSVVIAGSSSDATFMVDILSDLAVEPNELFVVKLVEVSTNAGIGTGTASVSIVDDDSESGSTDTPVLYRVNAGGPQIAAIDNGPDWSADTEADNSPFLAAAGSNDTSNFTVLPGATVAPNIPGELFLSERFDRAGGGSMEWAFKVPEAGEYEVRLYVGNGFSGTDGVGDRVFDVSIEGNILAATDDIDLIEQFGHLTGGVIAVPVVVSDGELNIEFLHGVENPLINGLEVVQLGGQTPQPTQVAIAPPNPDTVVETGDDGSTVLTFPVSFSSPPANSVTVEYAVTVDGNVTTGLTQSLGTTGGAIGVNLPNDNVDNGPETVTVTLTGIVSGGGDVTWGNTTAIATVTEDDGAAAIGRSVLAINLNSNDVKVSNFGDNSFQITNIGDKDIAKVEIDVTNALYPDSVFDPFGQAGDTVSKALTIDDDGSTGVTPPNSSTYIGAGGSQGFEGIQLFFDQAVDGGFNPEETLGFSVDMDPNSVAGTNKSQLDGGANPPWDIGGVSGAELIGSSFTVTFTDGTTARGQLQGVGNQGGSQSLATQDPASGSVSLMVNGWVPGAIGTYGPGGPSVVIKGPAGATARVVLTKGFIQPINPYAQFLENQLNLLAESAFPANNAVELQTVDVVLTGSDQDITSEFDFSGVPGFNFAADPNFPLSLDEDQLPLGFVASVIDPSNGNLPSGPVTAPIYLQFAETPSGDNAPPIANPDTFSTDEASVVTGNVLLNNGSGADTDADGNPLIVTALNGIETAVGQPFMLDSGALLTLNANGTFTYDPNGQFELLNDGDTATDSFSYTISDGNGGTDTASVNIAIAGVAEGGTTAAIELTLFDAGTDTLITAIADGSQIPLSTLTSNNLTIVASLAPSSPLANQVESILFNLNDGEQIQSESFEPYALFGDSSGNLAGAALPLGFNTLKLDLYSQNGLNGTLLESVTRTFTIWDDNAVDNALPNAVNDTVTTDEDTTVSGNVLGNDTDGDLDPLTVASVNGLAANVGQPITLSTGALLTLNADGSFEYDPNGQFGSLDNGDTASDSFSYSVVDGNGGTDTANVTVTIAGVDDITGTPVLEIGLYNADTDTLIQVIADGDTIQASTLPTSNLAIAAHVLDDSSLAAPVESIVLNLNQGQITKTENVEPYALFGDSSGNYVGGQLPQGNNTLVFELFSANGANGQLLETVVIDFAIA